MWERRRREEIEQETRPPRQLRSKPARLRTCAAPMLAPHLRRSISHPSRRRRQTKYITRHQRAPEPASANRTRVALLVQSRDPIQLFRDNSSIAYNYSRTSFRSNSTNPARVDLLIRRFGRASPERGVNFARLLCQLRAEARPYRAANGQRAHPVSALAKTALQLAFHIASGGGDDVEIEAPSRIAAGQVGYTGNHRRRLWRGTSSRAPAAPCRAGCSLPMSRDHRPPE